MACPACGLKALLHHERCAFCGHLLLEGPRVSGRQAEWDGLTEQRRAEFSLEFERGLAARRDWRERLKRNRKWHAFTGALTFLFMAGLAHFPVFDVEGLGLVLVLLIDAGLGAAAGLWLNRQGGGGYEGLAAFGGGYVAWTVISLTLGIIVGPFERGVGGGYIWGFFVLPGTLVAATFGYLFGLSLSLHRSLEE